MTEHPRLERQPAAVVGPPDPRLVLPGRAHHGLGGSEGPAALRDLRPPRGRADPGPRHLRHLVLVRPVAVLHARLAGRDRRPAPLLPGLGHGDGLRHHLLLGRPDDDARHPPPGDGRSGSSTCTAWSGTRTARMSKSKGNVVDPLDAIDETGADALRFALIHGTSPGNDQKFSQQRLEGARNFANKLWNAARFVARRAAGVDRGRNCASRAGGSGAPRACRALDPVACRGDDRGGRPGVRRLPVRRGDPRSCTTRSGASTATGASSSRRSAWRPEPLDRGARGDVVEARRVLDAYLRLLHPVMPFITEAIWDALPHRRDRPGAAHRRALAAGRGSGIMRRSARSGRSSSSFAASGMPGPRLGSSRRSGCPWTSRPPMWARRSRRSAPRSNGWPGHVR